MPRPRKPTSTTAPKRVRRPAKGVAQSAQDAIPAEEIAAEAYAQYLARGGQQGDPLTDWLIAEQIVKRRYLNGEMSS